VFLFLYNISIFHIKALGIEQYRILFFFTLLHHVGHAVDVDERRKSARTDPILLFKKACTCIKDRHGVLKERAATSAVQANMVMAFASLMASSTPDPPIDVAVAVVG
jgi:hypothetical protein